MKLSRTLVPALAAFLLLGCAEQPLTEYRPVIDPAASKPAKFERDLAECRTIALAAEAKYKERAEQEMGQRLLVGLLVGAAVGAAVGDNSNWAASGAAYGAASGAASVDTELAVGGPRRIVDRCLAERGHKVLSDPGKG